MTLLNYYYEIKFVHENPALEFSSIVSGYFVYIGLLDRYEVLYKTAVEEQTPIFGTFCKHNIFYSHLTT